MRSIKVLCFAFVLAACFFNCKSKITAVEGERQRPQTLDVLIKHGLNGIKVNYDMREMESMSTSDMYSYLEGLDLAIQSFLTDKSHPGSPLNLMPNVMKSYRGNASKPQQELETLIELINMGGSLCMPDLEGAADNCFYAEEGEDVEENWIFLLQIPDLDGHKFWAIVDKDGKEAIYNYGFR